MNTLYESDMNNSNNNNINILDLPDEILFLILQKLNMVDVLYSCVDVNQRFHRLALDSFLLHDINMTTIKDITSLYDQTSSIDPKVLSRICKNVLPRIYDQAYKLTVDEYSAEQTLLASNYPKLYSLSLINFQKEILHKYLTDNLILRDLLINQITHLNIDIKETEEYSSESGSEIFAKILSLCKNLIVLNFCNMFSARSYSSCLIDLIWKRCIPSTLVKLEISVSTINDCLNLLDGPFICLSTLIINVTNTLHSTEYIISTKKLPNLKYFSFTAFNRTRAYDKAIVPLLCRMVNLEELKLYLWVNRDDSIYIDGIQLYDQFLIYMIQLKSFTFNIKTELSFTNVRLQVQSNEDIQRSFIGRGYQPVASYVYPKSFPCDSACYIYSLPYDFKYFKLDNSFQGGVFHKVRQLTMIERIPFQDKLFKLISQDFPFLEILRIYNSWSSVDNQYPSTLLTFPYLTLLDIRSTHVDYIERFLLKTNMHLPRLSNLFMKYELLILITDNFTKDATQFNFGKLKSLDPCQSFVRPKNFHQYFPLL